MILIIGGSNKGGIYEFLDVIKRITIFWEMPFKLIQSLASEFLVKPWYKQGLR